MSITAEPTASQAENTTFHVQRKIQWKGQRYQKGDTIEASDEETRAADFAAWLSHGWVRRDGGEAPASLPVATVKPSAAAVEMESADGTFRLLDPREIAPSPVNPRRHFAEDAMRELTDSVREKGVRVAISVRAVPAGSWYVDEDNGGKGKAKYYLRDHRREGVNLVPELMRTEFDTREEATAALPKWEIIAGERRWRAARYAGSETIRAIVEQMGEIEAAELQVIENDQREDLSPVESASGYAYLLRQPGYDLEMLIKRTSKSRSTIYARLQLLELPLSLQQAVAAGKVSVTAAQLVGADSLDPSLREQAANIVMGRGDTLGNVDEEDDDIPHEDAFDDEDEDDVPEPARAGEPPSFREVQRRLEALREKKREEDERATLKADLEARGFRVLEGSESYGIMGYRDEVSDSSGYVGADDGCPRDPKGRKWAKVLKDRPEVERRALIVKVYPGPAFKAVELFQREQANAALKALGLWDAAGSAADKLKLERRRKKEAEQREQTRMLADFAAIVEAARRPTTERMRGIMVAALIAMLPGYENEATRKFYDYLFEQFGIEDSRSGYRSRVVKYLSGARLEDVAAFLALFSVYLTGGSTSHYAEGRDRLNQLLGLREGESGPNVRTSQ